MNARSAACALFACLATAQLAGQQLSEVTVFGDARELRLPSSAVVTVIDARALAASGARTLDDALAGGVNGVRVERQGGRGQGSTLSIRGSSAAQVLLLVDGVPQTAVADLSSIPVDDIARIEIVRGAASARYGDRAFGGVVNIVTRGAAADKVTLAAGAASFGTWSSALSLPFAAGPVSFRVRLAREFSDGGWLFPGQIREEPDGATTLGGERVAALNTGYTKWRGRCDADVRLDETSQLAFRGEFWDTAAGVPGTIDFPTTRAALDDRGARLTALATLGGPGLVRGDALDLRLGLLSRRRLYRDFSLYTDEDRYSFLQYGVESVWKAELGRDGLVRVGVEGRIDALDASVSGGTAALGRQSRITGAIFSDAEYGFGRVRLSGAVRLDAHAEFAARVSPQIGVAVEFEPRLRLRSNLGTAYRVPSFEELFWPETYFAVGNAALRPERSVSADLGLEWQPGERCVATLTAFASRSTDLILWQPSAGGVWRPTNVGSVFARGIEASLRQSLPFADTWALLVEAEYTLQVNENKSGDGNDGRQLPRQPHEKGSLAVTLRETGLGSVRLAAGYTGFRYVNMANTKYLGDHLLFDFALDVRITAWLRVRAGLKNIFDVVCVDMREYPVPGREWSLGLEVSL